MNCKCLGELKAGIRVNLNKIGKVPHECIPPSRTAFGFEYKISFRAEHNDAEISRECDIDEIDPKIKRISSRRFKGGEISEHGFSNFPENW